MHDLTTFEQRLAARLENELARAMPSFDASAIAATAMVPRTPWDRFLNSLGATATPANRRIALVVATALLALLAVVIGAGLLRSGGPRLALVTTDWEVVVANADGSDATVLGHLEPSALFQRLAWSPDGKHLAFMDDSWILTVVDRSGMVAFSRRLDDGRSTFSWSPDGDRLAIFDGALLEREELPGGPLGGPMVQPHLHVVEIVSGASWSAPLPGAFRYPWGQGARPAWSPEGRELAISGFEFEAGRSVHPSTIWVVDTAARTVRELTESSILSRDYLPTWLSNGRLLVSRLITGIWEVDPSTGVASQVYALEAPGPCTEEVCSGNFINTVEPSPDGTRVAMLVPGKGLVVLDLRTGATTEPALPKGLGGDVPIRWTADGTALLMRIGEVTGEPFFATKVGRLDLASGELSILADEVVLFDWLAR